MKMKIKLTRTCGTQQGNLKREVYRHEPPHQKVRKSLINNLMMHLKLLENKSKTSPKVIDEKKL
jgi:hypothetical protein